MSPYVGPERYPTKIDVIALVKKQRVGLPK